MMDGTSRTLAVVSHVWSGHVPAYHERFVRTFRELGWTIVDVRPPEKTQPDTDCEASVAMSLLSVWIRWLLSKTGLLPIIRSVRIWRRVSREILSKEQRGSLRADAVFFVYLDYGLLERGVPPWYADVCLGRPWGGVVNGPAAVNGTNSQLAARERVISAKGCRVISVTDESFVSPCESNWPGKTVVAMPEIADLSSPGSASHPVDRLRAFAESRRIVVLAGIVSRKKGVETLLKTAALAEASGDPVVFAIVGEFSAEACGEREFRELSALFETRPSNCWVYLHRVSDGPDFNAWIEAADIVWLAYRSVVYKSNVLTKAAHFKKPVVVSDGYVMAEHTRRFRLGEVIEEKNAPGALDSIRRLLSEKNETRAFCEFCDMNSSERFADTACKISRCLSA